MPPRRFYMRPTLGRGRAPRSKCRAQQRRPPAADARPRHRHHRPACGAPPRGRPRTAVRDARRRPHAAAARRCCQLGRALLVSVEWGDSFPHLRHPDEAVGGWGRQLHLDQPRRLPRDVGPQLVGLQIQAQAHHSTRGIERHPHALAQDVAAIAVVRGELIDHGHADADVPAVPSGAPAAAGCARRR